MYLYVIKEIFTYKYNTYEKDYTFKFDYRSCI